MSANTECRVSWLRYSFDREQSTPLARLYFNDCHHQEAQIALIRA